MKLRSKFQVDRTDAKMMGVCSGIANHTGVDVTLVRVGFVLTALMTSFFWVFAAYFLLGLLGRQKTARARTPRLSGADAARMSDLDRRLAEVDLYVAGSNSRLAREIEDLR
jgi:phage shock protein C